MECLVDPPHRRKKHIMVYVENLCLFIQNEPKCTLKTSPMVFSCFIEDFFKIKKKEIQLSYKLLLTKCI